MSRRSALSDIEQEQLCVIPNSRRDMERLYLFSEPDLSLIRQRRRAENRLGFAVQLCLLRYPSRPLTIGREVPATLVQWVAEQIRVIDRACAQARHPSDLAVLVAAITETIQLAAHAGPY